VNSNPGNRSLALRVDSDETHRSGFDRRSREHRAASLWSVDCCDQRDIALEGSHATDALHGFDRAERRAADNRGGIED
jgi:hypothetical protein